MPVPRVGAALAMLSWTCWTAAHLFGWFGSCWLPVRHPGRPPREHARRRSCNIRRPLQTEESREVGPKSHALGSDIRLPRCGLNSERQLDARTDFGPVVAVSAGDEHTCAVRSDGQLVCFGLNTRGQCDVPTALGPVSAVSAGVFHTCAVRSAGQLICFGLNDVPLDLGPVVAVSAGFRHTCAVRSNGQLVCFRSNQYGQCDVPTNLGPASAVLAGNEHTCAVRSDGQLVCFGLNRDGQCDVPTDLGPVVPSFRRLLTYLRSEIRWSVDLFWTEPRRTM